MITRVKNVSVSKSNSVTQCIYISNYKIWKSLMLIKFRNNTQLIKLTVPNLYHSLTRYILYKIRGLDIEHEDVILLWNAGIHTGR